MLDQEEQWTEWYDGQRYMQDHSQGQNAHVQRFRERGMGQIVALRGATAALLAGIAVVGLLLAVLLFSSRPTLQPVETPAIPQTKIELTAEANRLFTSAVTLAAHPVFPDMRLDKEAIYNSFPDELEDEHRNKLIELAYTDEDYLWIVQHVADYAFEGSYTQAKVLRLAASDQNAKEYVRYWPERLRNYGPYPCTEEIEAGTIPVLYQYDSRWGYTEYSSTGFGTTGCCPTTLAMVYQGLTGDISYSPYDMGVLAQQEGYMDPNAGTNGDMLYYIGQELGLKVYKANLTADELLETIEEGKAIVLNVGPGIFTQKGHFLVAWKIASNGEVVINDPYSSVRTGQTWTAQTLIDNTKVCYVFSY